VMLRMLGATGGGGGERSTVIAVDVSSSYQFPGSDYGDSLSGGWMLLMRLVRSSLNPLTWQVFGGRRYADLRDFRVPSMGDIQSQLAYVSSVRQFEEAKQQATLFLRPPVESVGILEWHRAREVEGAGYQYARRALRQWKRDLAATNDFRLRFLQPPSSGKNKRHAPLGRVSSTSF